MIQFHPNSCEDITTNLDLSLGKVLGKGAFSGVSLAEDAQKVTSLKYGT